MASHLCDPQACSRSRSYTSMTSNNLAKYGSIREPHTYSPLKANYIDLKFHFFWSGSHKCLEPPCSHPTWHDMSEYMTHLSFVYFTEIFDQWARVRDLHKPGKGLLQRERSWSLSFTNCMGKIISVARPRRSIELSLFLWKHTPFMGTHLFLLFYFWDCSWASEIDSICTACEIRLETSPLVKEFAFV